MSNVNPAINRMVQNWQRCGVHSGDTVLVHSSLRRTLMEMKRQQEVVSSEDVLDSFLAALGPNGTLLMPLFNFDFPKTKMFDIRHTPSQMGAMTEAARRHPQAIRTGHPIYSFAVIGKNADRFRGIDNQSGYGEDSPFAVLRALDGKIASLDLPDQNSMTFYHHVEEMLGVPYRYFKEFEGEYIDASGQSSHRVYKLFVRDVENGVLTHVDPAGERMWQAGLYKGDRPKIDAGLRTVRAVEMFDFVSEIIHRGEAENTLFKYEGEK